MQTKSQQNRLNYHPHYYKEHKRILNPVKISFIYIVSLYLFSSQILIRAEEIDVNGMFEVRQSWKMTDPMKRFDFESLGFEFRFKPEEWIKGWIVNQAESPAMIQFLSRDTYQCEGQYLKIISQKKSHLYLLKSFPPQESYQCSFFARGKTENDKKPTIKLVGYDYFSGSFQSQTTQTAILGTANLTDLWEEYKFSIPPRRSDVSLFRIAFSFEGECDFDRVKLECHN